jgi:hypothetical protein
MPIAQKEVKMESRKAQLLGRYIVADPAICHGQPTLKHIDEFVLEPMPA